MALLTRKAKHNAAEFSREFYETYLFGHNSLGVDVVSAYAESVKKVASDADPSFAEVDSFQLKEELLGLQLEMIGTAWTHISNPDAALANSEFTKQYLIESDREYLWELMGEYNRFVAQAATYGLDEKSRFGRAKITYLNSVRFYSCKECVANGHDPDATGRVANRVGSEGKWKNGLAPHLLAIKLMRQLEFDCTQEAAEPLTATVYGFYKGASEALDGVKLIA